MPALLLFAGCVYFNSMYNANHLYDEARRSRAQGNISTSRVDLDSVVAKTGRILEEHPNSKYADDAAILRTRAQLMLQHYDGAYESAGRALQLTTDPRTRATALGLRGWAANGMESFTESDSLLSAALEGKLSAEDAATFHFWRGRSRLQLGQDARAAKDLEDAVRSSAVTEDVRQELATALVNAGEYADAARLSIELMGQRQTGEIDPATRRNMDTLVLRAPNELLGALDRLESEKVLSPTREATVDLLRGRALEQAGRPDSAGSSYERSREVAPLTLPAAEAGYREARLRLRRATDPATFPELESLLQRAFTSASPAIRDSAGLLLGALRSYDGLMGAYESRGSDAAEALLRAGEIAQVQLQARALSRSLYRKYLELRPSSPWAPKAVAGIAASYGGEDDGEAPPDSEPWDRRVDHWLGAVSPGNPYLVALRDEPETAETDSAYARLEAQLARRLDEIRKLYAPAEIPTPPSDTSAAQDTVTQPADSAGRKVKVNF